MREDSRIPVLYLRFAEERSSPMSVSLIRCLLAVLALSETCDAVASKDVAHLLGVKRPTIHRSLQLLVEKGMIEKELYGDVFLTEKGRAMARTLETRRDDLALLFARQFGLSPEESVKAAFALMSELSDESLEKIHS